jgi:DNA-binding NtrC family response regulator
LKERKEDINILVKYFLTMEPSELHISKSALQAMNDYQWKGNVRELESVIKRAAIFARSEKRNLIRLSDLPNEIVKESRYNFEDLVIDSLRNKKFSHSSVTETAKELGNVNRTMISENLRGVVLKTLVENNYDIEKTISEISGTDESEALERVNNKVQTFLLNIENDLSKAKSQNFDELKRKFSSKYKNLPAKFHPYLDEVIKWKIKNG